MFPNTMPSQIPVGNTDHFPEWITYCTRRSPNYKMHTQRGHALGAISNNIYGGGILYRYDPEIQKYCEVLRVNEGQKTCNICNKINVSSITRIRIKWGYTPLAPIIICWDCYNKS